MVYYKRCPPIPPELTFYPKYLVLFKSHVVKRCANVNINVINKTRYYKLCDYTFLSSNNHIRGGKGNMKRRKMI